MSSQFSQNLRNFFVDHVSHRAAGTVADVFEPVPDEGVAGAEGVIGIHHHGHVVLAVAHADQDLPAQLGLEPPGGFGLADALGVDVDDPGGGPEDNALVPEDLLELPVDLVDPGKFLFSAVVQVCHGHIPELPVEG